MARGGSLPQHAHLGGGEKMWERFQCLFDHRPFSYLFFGTSSTYFGDKVAFVLCSVWMDASIDQQLLCGYSSWRERKVFVISSLPLPVPSPHTLPPPTHTPVLCQRVLIYSEIFVVNFGFWNGSYIIINWIHRNLVKLVFGLLFVDFWLVEICKEKEFMDYFGIGCTSGRYSTVLISTNGFWLTLNWGLSVLISYWNLWVPHCIFPLEMALSNTTFLLHMHLLSEIHVIRWLAFLLTSPALEQPFLAILAQEGSLPFLWLGS